MVTLWESTDANAEAAENSGIKLVDTFGFKIPSLRPQNNVTQVLLVLVLTDQRSL